MRNRMLAAVFVILAACAGSEPQPSLTISPSGNQPSLQGPQTVTASPPEIAGEVIWSLSGPGSLSGNKGAAVVYRPAVPPDPSSATVTASARGQTAAVTFTAQLPPAPPSRPIAGLTGNVDVTYDQYDIPHIFCAAERDCFAVQGYIHAQDRLFQMDLYRRIAEGRVSELFGSAGVSQDKQFRVFFVTRDGQKLEDALAARLDTDPTTKALLQAYISGVNAYIDYLAAHPTLMPAEYAQLPPPAFTPGDIPHWTLQDTMAFARLLEFQLSETLEGDLNYGLFAQVFGQPFLPDGVTANPLFDAGKVNAYMRARPIVRAYPLAPTDPSFFSAPLRAQPVPAFPDASAWLRGMAAARARLEELRPLFGNFRTGAGSNNWAVDAAHSATGFAMVANDPHLSLDYPPNGHLATLTAADSSGLNLAGWTFPGFPGALIGRGAHVAWGDTVVGYDVTDLYLEKLSACGGSPVNCGAVVYNNAPEALVIKTFPIAVRGGAADAATVLIAPHHGPIINYDPANASAISMRWAGHEITDDLRAFLELYVATGIGDISEAPGTAFGALKHFTVGAQNFMLADDAGNIGYDPHALVPQRPWVASAFPWLPLPGDTGAAEWGGNPACSDLAAADNAACWVPDNLLPHACGASACAVKPTKGYLATANSDPAGYGDDGNPAGTSVVSGLYPGYLSFDWSDPSAVRYARIAERLKAKTANGGKVSVDDMASIQTDHVMLLAKLFHPSLPASISGTQAAAYAAAKAVWDQWDADGYDCPTGLSGTDPNGAPDTNATHVRDSAGCLLFHTFLKTLLHNVFDDDFAVVSHAIGEDFGANADAELRAMLYMLDAATPAADTHLCNEITPGGTPGPSHTCGGQVGIALAAASASLTNAYGASTNWLWGRVHTLTIASPAPFVTHGFSAGPYARPGGVETVDVGQQPGDSQSSPLVQSYGAGSNVRYIAVMDPAAANAQVKMQLPGPERDQPALFTSTLTLIQMYVQNQYFDFPYGHQVDNKGVSTQRFTGP